MTTIGVVALLLGVLLIVVEAHAPTAGVLGALGALMIGAGVWMLFTSDGIGQLIAIPVTAGGRGSRPGRGGGSESKSAYRAPRSRAYGDGISCRLGRDRSQLDRCAGSGRARRRIMACSNGIRVRRFCARRGRIRRRRAGSRPDSESAPSVNRGSCRYDHRACRVVPCLSC